jgi:type IV secretory pathway VirD2 relaxase
VADNPEKEFTVRPRKPRAPRTQPPRVWSAACFLLRRCARAVRAGQRRRARAFRQSGPRVFNQRCAVRVTYSRNTTRGQWKAHGRYIARESAHRDRPQEAGFDEEAQGIDIASRLRQWQAAGDERLWKLIVSPEFGDRTDLPRLTRELVKRMEEDLRTTLEWVAVCHFDTDNPHVHVALRGVRDNGKPLSLNRDYVKRGIRSVAEDLCTCQLGHRTRPDVLEAQRREVSQQRFTSLDRTIAGDNTRKDGPNDFTVIRDTAQSRNQHVIARLSTLEGMGLAEAIGPSQWRVRCDFETALRAMQRADDRQKMLAAHGVRVSDPHLPLRMLDSRRLKSIEGRVLLHGEDEGTGRTFMMLEGTDAVVHCVYHTPEMSEACGRGEMRADSFVRVQKVFVDGRQQIEIDDLGDANELLSDRAHFQETARRLLRRGVIPVDDGWSGWLGRYQKGLRSAAVENQQDVGHREHAHPSRRGADHSRGR